MQTFLPYPNFTQSAEVLDNKRLGKQRVEAYTILRILLGETDSKVWKNHPAVLMWKGYESKLLVYAHAITSEWRKRGYVDTIATKLQELYYKHTFELSPDTNYDIYRRPVIFNPPWLGNDKFHASHRSNLLRKDPVHYGQFGWTEPDNLPYWWPTKEKEEE